MRHKFQVSAKELGAITPEMSGAQITESDLIREKDVSRRYGFGLPWLRRARRELRGPKFVRLGKMIFYRRADVEAYVTAHEVQTRDAE